MEADSAPFTPLTLSVLRFTGSQSYGYTDQRKVEADVRSLKIEPETSCSESRALANWAMILTLINPYHFKHPRWQHDFVQQGMPAPQAN